VAVVCSRLFSGGGGIFSFSLEKWYFDCVDVEGRAWIGYAAELKWLWLRLSYLQSLTCRSGQGAEVESLFAGYNRPSLDGGTLCFGSSLYNVDSAGSRTESIRESLPVAGGDNRLDWHCIHPNCEMTVTRPGQPPLRGTGYIEKLSARIQPWGLPFEKLVWGRFTGAVHSVVWIEWNGADGLRWVYLDGKRVLSVSGVSPHSVRADMFDLEIQPFRDLVDNRPFQGDIGRRLGLARVLLPASIYGLQERKWLARGSLKLADGTDRGWVIHETVESGGCHD